MSESASKAMDTWKLVSISCRAGILAMLTSVVTVMPAIMICIFPVRVAALTAFKLTLFIKIGRPALSIYYWAYVLTLLPGRVFQVFQVVGGEEKREKKEFIDNLFKSIISVYICFKCFSPF
jgi:hypothetical protein